MVFPAQAAPAQTTPQAGPPPGQLQPTQVPPAPSKAVPTVGASPFGQAGPFVPSQGRPPAVVPPAPVIGKPPNGQGSILDGFQNRGPMEPGTAPTGNPEFEAAPGQEGRGFLGEEVPEFQGDIDNVNQQEGAGTFEQVEGNIGNNLFELDMEKRQTALTDANKRFRKARRSGDSGLKATARLDRIGSEIDLLERSGENPERLKILEQRHTDLSRANEQQSAPAPAPVPPAPAPAAPRGGGGGGRRGGGNRSASTQTPPAPAPKKGGRSEAGSAEHKRRRGLGASGRAEEKLAQMKEGGASDQEIATQERRVANRTAKKNFKASDAGTKTKQRVTNARDKQKRASKRLKEAKASGADKAKVQKLRESLKAAQQNTKAKRNTRKKKRARDAAV